MKIKTKLLIMSAVCILGAVFMGVESVATANEINRISSGISNRWVPAVMAAEKLNRLTSDYRILEYDHIMAESDEEMVRVEQGFHDIREQVEQGFEEYEAYVIDGQDRALMEEAQEGWQAYLETSDQVLALSRFHHKDDAMRLLHSARVAYHSFSSLILEATEMARDATQIANEKGQMFYQSMNKAKIVIILAMLLVTCLCVYYIVKSIDKPVLEVSEGAWRVANGDLDVHLANQSGDEIGHLTRSVNELIRRVRSIVEDEKYILREIGVGNYDVASSCPKAYQGDFAPILYIFEGMKTRLKEAEDQKQELALLKRQLDDLRKDREGLT